MAHAFRPGKREAPLDTTDAPGHPKAIPDPADAGPGLDGREEPIRLFEAWMAEAAVSEPSDPNAMCLATATPEGRPAARIVLLKGLDARGFVFHSHYDGRKGTELTANPFAALCFHWKTLGRQVRVEGRVEHEGAAESDAYFATRPRLSRLGAWASQQSRPLPERAALVRRLEEAQARFPGEAIPRPPHWGGFRLVPDRIEFWQDMPFRLHDRLVYARPVEGEAPGPHGWTTRRLYP